VAEKGSKSGGKGGGMLRIASSNTVTTSTTGPVATPSVVSGGTISIKRDRPREAAHEASTSGNIPKKPRFRLGSSASTTNLI
jgi:hypothetical protein